MRKNTKRSAIVAGVATVLIGGGVAAWAATGWNIGGSGTSDATAATITPLTAESTFAKSLYPGLVTTMLTKVTNPNEFDVKLTGSVTPGAITVSGADPDATSCKNGITTSTFSTNFPGTPTITKGAVGQDVTSNVTVNDLPQTCAGKTIHVTYTFTGVSQA
jgi:hypothetical protein